MLCACPSDDTSRDSVGEHTTEASEPASTSDAPATSDAPTTSGGSGTSGDDTTTTDTATTGDDTSTTGDDATTSSTTTTTTTAVDDTEGDEDAWKPKGCPKIYAQDLLPTFELEISPSVLAGLKQEWLAADDNNLTKFPLEAFTYKDITITNASIRLRGNSSHWHDQKKMQFEVEFNTYDKKGRFLGLRHVLFDAAEYNRSYLRDRLALAILRDAGVPAPCANNARVVVNGEYYGLFTSIEKVDKEFLERHFENSDANLYKRAGGKLGWKKERNKESKDVSDVKALNAVDDLDDLLALMNLEQALLEWAAEAVVPDRDGAWAGGLNFYVYNDPATGFNVLPWDLDDTFTRLPPEVDPATFKKPEDVFHGRPFYDIALADPVWFGKYVDAVEHVLKTAYDVDVLQGRIDAWAAQIAAAAAEDPNRPFTLEQHLAKVKEKRAYVAKRASYLKQWVACWRNGGKGVCQP